MLRLILGSAVAALLGLAPEAQAASYTTVQQTVSITTTIGSANVNVLCPDGYTPVGGGWRQSDPNNVLIDFRTSSGSLVYGGNLARFVPVGSFPNGQGWQTFGYSNGPIIVVFYAVCATA